MNFKHAFYDAFGTLLVVIYSVPPVLNADTELASLSNSAINNTQKPGTPITPPGSIMGGSVETPLCD